MTYRALRFDEAAESTQRYRIADLEHVLTWRQVLAGWAEFDAFTNFFSTLLADCRFEAFRWETPGLTETQLDDDFEFVLVESRHLARRPSSDAFHEYFTDHQPVVHFANLGGDCQLVVPCPQTAHDDFAHLGAFLRSADAAQTRELWKHVAAAVEQRISQKPLWLSTAGDGVPWLHVRLDDQPKYYDYLPYRQQPAGY